MARSAVLAGRTAADTVALTFQVVLMLIVALLVGFQLHEGVLEALLAFGLIVMVGYTFTWVAAFAGLSLKTVEAVQAAMFTLVFPVVFISSVFVPVSTFPPVLETIANANPVTIWSDTVRVLVIGDAYVDYRAQLHQQGLAAQLPSLGALITWSTAWFAGLRALFAFLGVRVYRRT
jgi:ABC-2 type transport system permease protein